MADERILVTYTLNATTGDIHRKKGKGDEIYEDIVVAKYNVEKQTVYFKDLLSLRNHKTGVMTFLSENEMLVKSWQREDLEPDQPITKAVPPRPKKNKHEGDKTPAVVEWYFKYKPNEFATRYGVLGVYSGPVIVRTPLWVPRPVDGVLEYRGDPKEEKTVSNAVVALRKTHLTYTPEECVDWSDDVGEDAFEYEEEVSTEGYQPPAARQPMPHAQAAPMGAPVFDGTGLAKPKAKSKQPKPRVAAGAARGEDES